MKNSHKVVVHAHQGTPQSTTHDVPVPASGSGALRIKAVPGARYQLIDNLTGQGPDNIRVRRAGNDLGISLGTREEAELVITDFFEFAEPGFAAVIGEAAAGAYHAYIPESGESAAMVGNLSDGSALVGMALGGETVTASGRAVGALVAAAGVNPLMVLPLALLGAGGGGGGGGTGTGERDVTPPKLTGARLHPEDDTGISNSDGITSDSTPRWLVDADADAVSASVTMNGKTYTSTSKNAQGQFVVQVPEADALGNGLYTFSVVVKDAAGNTSPALSGSINILSAVLPPANLLLKDLSLKEDSGSSANDFLTKERALQFSGHVDGFDAALQKCLVQVLRADGVVLSMGYVNPDGKGDWAFDNRALPLGVLNDTAAYLIKTSVVDLAGNILKSTSQSLVIDLQPPALVNTSSTVSASASAQQSFTTSSFTASEQGVFTSGAFATSSNSVELAGNTFAPGQFLLNFTDLAGNLAPSLTNKGQTWNFQNTTVALNQGPSAGAVIDRIGSVGKYLLESSLDTLDLASLYDKVPAVGEKAAINHISTAGGGNDAVTISMDDVLALGVKNSFTTSGRLQMRVDGDASDRVFLDNKMGSSGALHWTSQGPTSLEGTQYSLYTNSTLGLELFIQQGMQVTAVL